MSLWPPADRHWEAVVDDYRVDASLIGFQFVKLLVEWQPRSVIIKARCGNGPIGIVQKQAVTHMPTIDKIWLKWDIVIASTCCIKKSEMAPFLNVTAWGRVHDGAWSSSSDDLRIVLCQINRCYDCCSSTLANDKFSAIGWEGDAKRVKVNKTVALARTYLTVASEDQSAGSSSGADAGLDAVIDTDSVNDGEGMERGCIMLRLA
jgi:hypothetical protein